MNELFQIQYLLCKNDEKKKIAKSIINAIKAQIPPSRFLKFHSHSGLWNLIDDKRALDKSCQSLRDGRSGTDFEYPSEIAKNNGY